MTLIYCSTQPPRLSHCYAPGIAMGEKHPPSYTAFRKRSYKWAYGCVQTLRAHWWTVLRSRRFSFAEKLSFFQFAGFYCLQCVLLVYLCFVLFAVPLGALGVFMPDPRRACWWGRSLSVSCMRRCCRFT